MIITLNTKRVILAAGLWLAMSCHIAARGIESNLDSGNTCENNIARLDNAHNEAGEDSVLIAVARLGDGERLRKYNFRRLHNLRLYLTRFRKRSAQSIVLAEGERGRGRGRIEIYARGKLIDVLELGRGEDLYAGSCAATSRSDKLFYDSRFRDERGLYCPAGGKCR